MKKQLITTCNFTILILCLFMVSAAFAGDSLLINYQGRLTDDVGDPVTGTPSLTFTIYDRTGVSKWTETHPSVEVTGGLFDVILGSESTLPDSVFNGADRYLGIQVGTEPEISPRTLFTSVPGAAYAYRAFNADTAGFVEGGVGITQIIKNQEIEILQGYMYPLAYDSIHAPASGYVLCQASVNMYCKHVTGNDGRLNIEFRDTSLVHMEDQEFYWSLASSLPSDDYLTSYSIQRVFAVDSGYNWFYLIGINFGDAGDTFYVRKVVMSLMFIPVGYGTVQVTSGVSEPLNQPERIPIDDRQLEELK